MMNDNGQVKEQVQVDELLNEEHQLILYNDDVNTFDYVIDQLVAVCQHDLVQAEQCAILVHYKGKCSVKKGKLKELVPMCSALLDLSLIHI